jgi:alkylhydroperoxidase family enzyme
MMTSRVPMVSLEGALELGEAMGLPARRTQSEAFRVLANNPGVARVAYSQLIQLLENNKFDTRLRELMIMRIGWVTGSAYEWTQHWRVATTAGIPPEDILAVRDWRNSERFDTGGQGDPRRYRRVPRRQIHFGCRLGRGGETCHRARTAGRIHHRHGQLDDVFPVVPKPAHSAGGGSDGLAARWSGLPGGAAIGDRRTSVARRR